MPSTETQRGVNVARRLLLLLLLLLYYIHTHNQHKKKENKISYKNKQEKQIT